LGISTTRLSLLILTGYEAALTSSVFWKVFLARISLCVSATPRPSPARAPPVNRMRAVTGESNDGLVIVIVNRFSRIQAEPVSAAIFCREFQSRPAHFNKASFLLKLPPFILT
jgi:hypothetical protein